MNPIAHSTRRRFVAALALTATPSFPMAAPATAAGPDPRGKLTHIGLIWLKNPGNAAERQRLIDALHQFAREIPEVEALSVGRPHPSESPLVDSTFDVCFAMQFADQAAADRYAKHPTHQQAARELFLPLSRRLLFHDFINE